MVITVNLYKKKLVARCTPNACARSFYLQSTNQRGLFGETWVWWCTVYKRFKRASLTLLWHAFSHRVYCQKVVISIVWSFCRTSRRWLHWTGDICSFLYIFRPFLLGATNHRMQITRVRVRGHHLKVCLKSCMRISTRICTRYSSLSTERI